MNLQEKIRGMLIGGAIGDALGAPYELWKKATIEEQVGLVKEYGTNDRRKIDKGATTDDTQLTMAIADSLIESRGFDIDSIASHHVKAFKESVLGWGGTTKRAIARLAADPKLDPLDAARLDDGTFNFSACGNGPVMKLSPIVPLFLNCNKNKYLIKKNDWESGGWTEAFESLAYMTTMTHPSAMAMGSVFAHAICLFNCLVENTDRENEQYIPDGRENDTWKEKFVHTSVSLSQTGRGYINELKENEGEDIITDQFLMLYTDMTPEVIEETFNGAGPYVYDSMPAAYAHFLANPDSIDCVYNGVTGGGDADTVGAIVGNLLGARCGINIFPTPLVEGLKGADEILDKADKLYELIA